MMIPVPLYDVRPYTPRRVISDCFSSETRGMVALAHTTLVVDTLLSHTVGETQLGNASII